jgi:two-component system sensor histidine kinase ChvG
MVTGSLTLRLTILVSIFVALPIILYGQFEYADRQTRTLISNSIQYSNRLIAKALFPVLDMTVAPSPKLDDALAKFNQDGTVLELMFQPKDHGDAEFYFIASAPQVTPAFLADELASLKNAGILQQLARTCSLNQPVDIRHGSMEGHGQTGEVLSSVIPIQSRKGCWVLVSSHVTSEFLDTTIGRSYAQTRQIRLAVLIYCLFALVATATALGLWKSIQHFSRVTREIRNGRSAGNSFSARNVIPELSSVAHDFDDLVKTLHSVAHDIRSTAEDNAHSFKTPIATIQSALAPLLQLVPEDNPRAQHAARMIDQSLNRLKALVDAAQRLDNNTADLIEVPRDLVDLTQLVADILLRYRETLRQRDLRLDRRLNGQVLVLAGAGILETVFENIIDNAISFSPAGSTVMVRLSQSRSSIELAVSDCGPGIEAERLDRIFDRYYSLRPYEHSNGDDADAPSTARHSGLGLWIVKRNVEALGGRVRAINRPEGGLCIHITLPPFLP